MSLILANNDHNHSIKPLKFFNEKSPILTTRFNTTGDYIATGNSNKNITIWKVPDNKTNENIIENIEYENYSHCFFKSAVTCLRWSSIDPNQIFASSADKSISIIDLNKGLKIKTFKDNSIINEIHNSKKDLIVSCSDNDGVKGWDSRSKDPIFKIDSKYPVLTTCIDSNQTRFYFSGIDPTINCYDLRKLDSPDWKEVNHTSSVTSLSMNQDESYIISKSLDASIKYYDSRLFIKGTRSKPYVFDGPTCSLDDLLIRCKIVNIDGKDLIISGSNDGFIYVWDFISRKLIQRLDGHNGCSIDVDVFGNHLASSSVGGELILRSI
ncbi:hypothetical protein CANARDRAFT_6905 [[Candida] arabinofermentans NRRL YB-2248]|uniref:Uncharacterized protein n=1 Tax=[Candida] arabinofermentans NRRL YB-2248 TaxID=983967 RepID=A0A1E4T3U4_9ASCO|nr:hypothetical protein CANARDRAFT_6905 [[Candida] arabinofermentans NRRL YB-2248]